ncbi:hypothetical protein IscW_ISCW009252 [Ixodes scapularis]|uniref:Uncharacterized protein n=1 Tax=Ixodes scapularis TaxID=6945 RepID=B7PX74_IXOSC|nr:hypothetical protein IscW_ISCW009252 [Ixodes scapularis]|eukprot:XP_002399515.1 hypothetical protein IscW_ISCW009252 [Ixodes scapularis]
MPGFFIVDSVHTPLPWYSLIPIFGFSLFLLGVIWYQRTEFYWLTDVAQDLRSYFRTRYRKASQHSCESHIPWFISGNSYNGGTVAFIDVHKPTSSSAAANLNAADPSASQNGGIGVASPKVAEGRPRQVEHVPIHEIPLPGGNGPDE